MGFDEFVGNGRIVGALRGMLRRGRMPSGILFTGPRGIGKFTLARMFAEAANCLDLPDDFCGHCVNCVRISRLADPAPLVEQGLAERGEGADSATIERTPLILETHPDVWLLVPDPVRLRNPVARPILRVGQLRAIQRAAYFQPQARRRVFILDGADTMRWNDADVFLKILEEPPETATLILLAESPDSLLPTIRSRCLQFHFAPVPADVIVPFLAKKSTLKAMEQKLAAHLSGGSPGLALSLDLGESVRLRRMMLDWLEKSIAGERLGEVFAASAQLTKQEKVSFENILELLYSLLTDLLESSQSPKLGLLRNPDLGPEIDQLARSIRWDWILGAVGNLDQLDGRLRRNINRTLGLDAYASSLSIPRKNRSV
jgi:DNA polymerase III subunit delta'